MLLNLIKHKFAVISYNYDLFEKLVKQLDERKFSREGF